MNRNFPVRLSVLAVFGLAASFGCGGGGADKKDARAGGGGDASAPSLRIEPAAHNFGSVETGMSGMARAFTVTNAGGGSTGAITAQLMGANAAEFSILSNGCASALSANGSCTVTLQFSPTTAGAKVASLSVKGDATTAVTATLSGTGTTPAALKIDPLMPAFGSIAVGASSMAMSLTVTNSGGQPSGAITVGLGGANPGDFAIAMNNCMAALMPGATCKIDVRFSPMTAGMKAASLTATGMPGGPATATLTGTALAGGTLAISPTPHKFPDTVSMGMSGVASFTVTNNGAAATGAPMAVLEGSDPMDFAIATNGCTAALMPGASCKVDVRFAPKSVGDKTANLAVRATPGGEAVAALSGKSIAGARVVVQPSSQSFGSVVVGSTSANVTLTVSNPGAVASGALAVALGGTDMAQFTVVSDSCNTIELSPAASCSIVLTFSPASAGAKTATLTVTATPGGMATAMLSGTGQAPGTLAITPSTDDFGDVGVGASSVSHTFTVTNNGGAATGPIATALAGTDPTDFPLVPGGNGCAGNALAPGQSCTVSVQFKPTGTGDKAAQLTISASPGGMLSAALSGTGLAPATLAISPTARDFGSIGTGSNSATVAFTVTNNGGSASGVPTVSLTGTNSDQFAVTNNGCTMALGAGDTCMITGRFSPTSMGTKAASLNVTANPGGTATAPLTGTGVAPASIAVNPTMQDFGTVLVGSSSSDLSFTITNNGTAATGSLTPTLGGADAAEFAMGAMNNCMNLAAGASCMLTVKFSPTSIGDKTATLSITAATGGTVESSLTGTAVGVLSISPTSKSFGNAALGISNGPTETFVVKNNNAIGGAASGNITTSLVAGTPAQFSVVGDTCNGQSIGAQGTCNITIRFTPASTTGDKMGTLSVAGAGGGMASAALSGVAVSALAISPAPWDFGPTVVGTFVERTLVVSNAATAPNTGIVTTTLSGTDVAQFAVATDDCTGTTLAGGATCNIKVRFIPSSTGAKSASVAVNATPGGSASSALTGAGTPAAVLAVTPAGDTFGDVYAASTSAAKTFTVSNPTANSATGPITFSVTGAGFVISGGTCTNGVTALTGGQSCTIAVQLSPAAGTTPGAKDGTLSVLASPGGSASATLSGTVLPQLSISPTTHDFGNVVVGQNSAERTFTVKNDSPTAVSGTLSAALAGTNANQFNIPNASNGCATPPAPGATCTLTVRFSPTSTGAKTADLTVTGTNVSVTATPLVGTGILDADLELTSTADVAYGTVPVGSNSGARTLTVINNGGVASGAITGTLAGANPGSFAFTGAGTCVSGTTTLAPGASCTFVVLFSPTAAGTRLATFTAAAANNTPGGSTTTVNLGGTGVADTLSISPTPHDFGAITATQTSSPVTFTVKNNGASTTGTLSAAVTGQFAIAAGGTCTNSTTLAANATCTYLVTFNPTGVPGDRAGSLDVTATPGGSGSAALYGRARKDATLTATPAGAFNFGQVTVGQSSPEYTVTVRNEGDVTSGTITAALSGANPSVFAISNSTCTTLAAGATCTVRVRYNPATAGTNNTADLDISATPGGAIAIPLSGTAVSAANLSLSPDDNDFGDQAVLSESAAVDFTVSNAAGALSTGTLGFALTNETDFRLDSSACPATLAGGASCVVKVYFKPRSIAAITGKLAVTASPGGTLDADLTGAGISALSVDTQTFPATAVGAASAEVTFTWTNATGAPTTGILSTVLAGSGASQFNITSDGCAGATLAGGATCEIKVRFVPTSAGAKTATITVSGTPGNSAAASLSATPNP